MIPLYFIDLDHTPIFQQLELEEALLRGSKDNYCIVNRGSPRAIVMGISGKTSELLDIEKVRRDDIEIIRRFSGGGTVIVDENTLFISVIFNKQAIDIQPYPEPILRWTSHLYQNSWNIPHFHLIENDYTIGKLKCGGNAQYIKKDRWLHHTSFLWDYKDSNMNYLLLPPKRPQYRDSRSHSEFLCRIKHHAPNKQNLIDSLCNRLSLQFQIIPAAAASLRWEPHRKALCKIF